MSNISLELIRILKTSRLFADLGTEAIFDILNKCKLRYLNAGEILFNQGEKSDGAYLLISGRLAAKFVSDKVIRGIGMINTGEIFGELGVISEQPRSLTIQAIDNSEVLFINADIFKELFSHNLSVCVATASPVMKRTFDNFNLTDAQPKTKRVVMLPADINLPLDIIYEKFRELAVKHPHVEFLHEKDFAATAAPNNLDNKLDLWRQDKEVSVVFLKTHDSNLARLAINEAQVVYLLANRQVNEDFHDLVVKTIKWQKQASTFRQELIIITDNSKTLGWSDKNLQEFNLCHKIRLDDNPSIDRVWRFIADRVTALVLSGGGVKGFAHIGAIKAITALKIPIDIVGGTSIGSLIGGLYAMGLSCQEIEERLRALIKGARDMLSWRSLTVPLLCFYSGKSVTQSLRQIFQDQRIEDLAIPYFCTSCNVSLNQATIHKHGGLFEKIRASISIPGLMPPAVIDGHMHVDGSMLKHLPVDSMKEILGSNSNKVIALLLPKKAIDNNVYNFPPVFTFVQSLLHRLGFWRNQYVIPSFSELFLRAVTFSGMHAVAVNRELADVLVDLGFEDAPLLAVDEKTKQQMLTISYEKTLAALTAGVKT